MEQERIRCLSPGEEIFAIASKDSAVFRSCYQIHLSSKTQIDQSVFRKTLHLLQRKVPILSLCIEKEDNTYWFCKRKDLSVDFQMLEKKEESEITSEILNSKLNLTEGPLWLARILIPAPISDQGLYTYKFFFGIHHSVTDGFTSFTVCRHFLNLLNDVIEGKDIDDKSLGTFTDGQYIKEAIERKCELEENDHQLVQSIKDELKEIREHEAFISDWYPQPPPNVDETRHLTRDFSQANTVKLMTKFKQEKVSFHSGFMAIADSTLLDMTNNLDVKCICIFHSTNLRRYSPFQNESLGCQVGPIRTKIDISHLKNGIWHYGRELNAIIKESLSVGRPFYEIMHYEFKSAEGKKSLQHILSDPARPNFEGSVSNMGDLKDLFPGTGNLVEVSWLSRVSNLHNFGVTFCHFLQTFRGRLLYSMSYTTRYLSDELANEFADKIFEKMKTIIEN